jgi:hypothetical protein
VLFLYLFQHAAFFSRFASLHAQFEVPHIVSPAQNKKKLKIEKKEAACQHEHLTSSDILATFSASARFVVSNSLSTTVDSRVTSLCA